MGLVVTDDGWRMPDWLWERIAPVLPPLPSHPLGCRIAIVYAPPCPTGHSWP
jgi:hypothetical protein